MHNNKTGGESASRIQAAQVVLLCAELQPTLEFFTDQLGFRLDQISPADAPRSALLSGYGLQVMLRSGNTAAPSRLRLVYDDQAPLAQSEVVAPNGTHIEFVKASLAPVIPSGKQELVVSRASGAAWVTGRAGMHYRDLLPGRFGGRFVASHIRIPAGGLVPDSVHHHGIRFQMIYCASGWVRVVYEDQGPPLVLAAGDCVLQPPHIRHRVLESSPGLDVIEIACPGEHDTFIDHELNLPTTELRPERDFAGQRFVRHVAARAEWEPGQPGFEFRDTGIAAATSGLAAARVTRASGTEAARWQHDGELLFAYVLSGELLLKGALPEPTRLARGDSVALPSGLECTLAASSNDLEFLELRLPA